MPIRQLSSTADLERYHAWVSSHPHGSLWQSPGWKTYQEALGRTVKIYVDEEAGQIRASALVVVDRTTGGLSTWEIPRGPVFSGQQSVISLMEAIKRDAKTEKAMTLLLSPMTELTTNLWPLTASRRHVHPEATRIIDLTGSEEQILAQMKQKGRYNIRLSEKNGVTVEQSAYVAAFARLMDDTAKRDGFRPSGEKTYAAFLKNVPGSFLLLAYGPAGSQQPKGAPRPVAGLIGAMWGTTGIYYYGASDHEHRELMAPYLLQWRAMQFCKAQGATQYDLFGVAPEGAIEHPWSGVSEFKAKFGGTVMNYPPEQEIVLKPMTKMLLGLKRKILG